MYIEEIFQLNCVSHLRILFFHESDESLKISAQTMGWDLQHSLIQLEYFWEVLFLHLPLDIVIPQLVTPPLSPTLSHGLLVLSADELGFLLLDSLAVVHEVDPEVCGEWDSSHALNEKKISFPPFTLFNSTTNLFKDLHYFFRSPISFLKISKFLPIPIAVWIPFQKSIECFFSVILVILAVNKL